MARASVTPAVAEILIALTPRCTCIRAFRRASHGESLVRAICGAPCPPVIASSGPEPSTRGPRYSPRSISSERTASALRHDSRRGLLEEDLRKRQAVGEQVSVGVDQARDEAPCRVQDL